jgi:hypothetical protein
MAEVLSSFNSSSKQNWAKSASQDSRGNIREEKWREEKRREAQQMHTSGAKFGGPFLMGLTASISSEGREPQVPNLVDPF